MITQALCLNPPEGEANGPDWPARIKHLMALAPLSYSLVVMLKDKIYAVRDAYGNRPLCLGKILPSNERKYTLIKYYTIKWIFWHDYIQNDNSEGTIIDSTYCCWGRLPLSESLHKLLLILVSKIVQSIGYGIGNIVM